MHKYYLVDIQYIRDIKKNKFKPKNIIKLSTSIRLTKKAAKNLKIDISGSEIEAKEENCTMADTKDIILFSQAFYKYI